MRRRIRRPGAVLASAAALVGLSVIPTAVASASSGAHRGEVRGATTTTPIQHLVVIFDENISFDHYFGTYPYATNPSGEPPFVAKPGTPTVNGLYSDVGPQGPTGPLLTNNPNPSNPLLLNRNQPMTCDQDHGYTAEQSAADHGAEDAYPQNTGNSSTTLAQCLAGLTDNGQAEPVPANGTTNDAVMDYYDGNTVTGLWNLAQNFALADNFYGTTYGPSTPGALNVTSAQTYGAICGPSSATINDAPCAAPAGFNASNVLASDLTANVTTVANQPPAGPGTTYSDADPAYDICSYAPKADGGDAKAPAATLAMGGPNIGDELSQSALTWGWFEGGFDDGFVPGTGTAPTTAQICSQSHTNVGGASVIDYSPHHEPFEYYASTANPMHLPPTSVAMVGHNGDQANHNYDLADFWAAADRGNMPQVSFLKAPAYQDGHAGYSDPLDEQTFLAQTIDHLESLPTWSSTAVVITWDDSDGWYDHVLGPVLTGSQTTLDTLTAPGACGNANSVPMSSTGQSEQGRCGLGPRLPMLVISPYSQSNYIDSTVMDQSSVVKFIEQNWTLPALGNAAADTSAGSLLSMFNFAAAPLPRVFIDPSSGEVVHGHKR